MTTSTPHTTRELEIQELTVDHFAPFGTVIAPKPDGTPFGSADAVLDLTAGTPRFYTMQIPSRGLRFDRITHHRNVTQVLGSAGGNDWFIAVAAPGELDADEIQAFLIPADTAISLNVGTWHAGPLFEQAEQSFFNLELSDTNDVDHHSVDLGESGLAFTLVLATN